MSSNLVRTPVVNKNGTLTHVHKKAVASTAKLLPAPSLSAFAGFGAATVGTEIRSLADAWEANVDGFFPAEEFNPRALSILDDALSDPHRNGKFAVSITVSSAFSQARADGDMARCRTTIHNAAAFAGCARRHGSNLLADCIEGLHQHTGQRTDYLTDATDAERGRAEALIGFLMQADQAEIAVLDYGVVPDTGEIDYVKTYDERLGALVMDRPELSDDILTLLRKLPSVPDYETLTIMLEHGEKTLREGML